MKSNKNATSFQDGNNAAEKWTEATVMPVLLTILEYIVNNNVVFIGTALINNGLYKEIWAYFNEKFKDCLPVFKLLKRIEQTIESNLTNSALDGEKNPTMAIFILKNKHDWSDKQDIEINQKPEKPIISFDS